MSKLKVVFLSVFYPFRGGIAQFNNELLLSLKAHFSVKALNFKRQYPAILFPGKTQLVDEHEEDPGINALATLDSIGIFSFFFTRKKIKRENPDVVLTSYWMPFFAPALGGSISGIRAKRVALLHNVIPHEKRFFDQWLNRYFLGQNDAFIVLSDTVKKDLLSLKPDAKYIQIPHPVYSHFGSVIDQSAAKSSLSIAQDRKVILFFGFIRKYKGLDILIEALSDLKEDYTLLLAGESYEAEKELDQQLQSAGITGEKICKHIRYIPDDQVSVYFSASDLCVLPYRSATQSGIAAIAKHFELPMVVTPVGELPNEVQHLKNGFVCDQVNAQSIKKGIIKTLICQEEFKAHINKENKEHTFANFSKKLTVFFESL
jgi:glycosyltransferase involved in cell wall biosynthesis